MERTGGLPHDRDSDLSIFLVSDYSAGISGRGNEILCPSLVGLFDATAVGNPFFGDILASSPAPPTPHPFSSPFSGRAGWRPSEAKCIHKSREPGRQGENSDGVAVEFKLFSKSKHVPLHASCGGTGFAPRILQPLRTYARSAHLLRGLKVVLCLLESLLLFLAHRDVNLANPHLVTFLCFDIILRSTS